MCSFRRFGDLDLGGYLNRLSEWPGGGSPPGPLRTVLDSLPSHGSRCPTARSRPRTPMSEEVWVSLSDPSEEPPCASPAASQPLVLMHGPADEVFVDQVQLPEQLGRVEASVVVDPAPDHGVEPASQVSQGRASASFQSPASYRVPDFLPGLPAHRGEKAVEDTTIRAFGATRSVFVPQEIEALVLV